MHLFSQPQVRYRIAFKKMRLELFLSSVPGCINSPPSFQEILKVYDKRMSLLHKPLGSSQGCQSTDLIWSIPAVKLAGCFSTWFKRTFWTQVALNGGRILATFFSWNRWWQGMVCKIDSCGEREEGSAMEWMGVDDSTIAFRLTSLALVFHLSLSR